MLNSLSWTQVSNTFITALPELSGAETKIMIAIFRMTIGWHKTVDILSISQLSGLTGISDRKTISAALKALEAREWIRIQRSSKGSKVDLLMGENPPNENEGGGIIPPLEGGNPTTKRLENPTHKRKGKKGKKVYISTGGGKPQDIPIEEAAENLIKYLNDRTGRDFEVDSDVALRELKGRANDGRTAAEIGAVIAFKCDQWMGTEWEGYLQPSTLFRKSKFDEYLVAMRYRQKEERGIRKNDGRKKEEGLNDLEKGRDETNNTRDDHGLSASGL